MVNGGDGDGYDDDPGDGEGEPPWLPRLHAASSGQIRPFLKRNRTQLEITKLMESFFAQMTRTKAEPTNQNRWSAMLESDF